MRTNTKSIPFLFFSCLFLLILFPSKAQDASNKSNQLIFSQSDTLAFTESLVESEEEMEDFEGDAGIDQSMMFIYFNWMPGYGLYSNFDILKVHYVHDRTVIPDTIVFDNYVHPVKYKPVLGKGMYGVKRRGGKRHWGIDISYPEGTPVVAAFDGIVRVSTFNNGGYGNLVILRHDNGLETYYAHFLKRLVNPGQLVRAGDTIGLGGNTGRSRGNHLHFETRYLGVHFNPANIIDFQNLKIFCDTLYVGGKAISTNKTPQVSSTDQNNTNSVSTQYITIKRGDTLGALAKKYKTTVDRIKKLNNMKSDFLREGQKLRVR